MSAQAGRNIGRYVLFDQIASGGMASVHLGRLVGPVGFARTVAIKRLHAQFAGDADFVRMFLDEARLAARIHHPNVVLTLDVVALEGEVFLVMEHVQGQSLSKLISASVAQKSRVPTPIALTVLSGLLNGLHAAHEAKGEDGEPLLIVHRDISPQNVLVGSDGVARVLDFGVAKAANRINDSTGEGSIKGKLAYMAPEQVAGGSVDRRTDIFAASVVAWEMLCGKRLFASDQPGNTIKNVLEKPIPRPSSVLPTLSRALDAIVLQGLERDPDKRFQSAEEMSVAIEKASKHASTREVGAWVREIAKAALDERSAKLARVESMSPPDTNGFAAAAADIAATRTSVPELPAKVGPPSQPPSQKTDVSFEAARRSIPVRQGPRYGLYAAIAALCVVLLLVGAAGSRLLSTSSGEGTSPDHAAGKSSPADERADKSAPEQATAPSASTPAPAVSSAPAAVPAPAASAGEQPKPQDEEPKPARPVAKKNPCSAVPASCKPPWTIQPNGSKRFKPACARYLSCM